jgi:hypothetical protein
MGLSKFEKLMLLNAHPLKFSLNIIGGIIALYFLWEHMIVRALVFGAIFTFIGSIITLKFGHFDADKISLSFLGRIFLRYSNLISFLFYLSSHIIIPIGFWIHSIQLFVLGLILLMAGLLRFT